MEIDINVADLTALGLSENAASSLSVALESHFREACDARSAWFQLNKTEPHIYTADPERFDQNFFWHLKNYFDNKPSNPNWL